MFKAVTNHPLSLHKNAWFLLPKVVNLSNVKINEKMSSRENMPFRITVEAMSLNIFRGTNRVPKMESYL